MGAALRSLRKKKKLTLEALFAKTDVSISGLAQIERGERGCEAETLDVILDALEVTPHERKRVVGLAIQERTKGLRAILEKEAS